MEISLREVRAEDLDLFFEQMQDPEAARMAAFMPEGPADRARFDAHWARVLASGDVNRTVLADGAPVGHAAVYGPEEEREVTYWIGRDHWGRGVATAALRALLELVPERPLRARAAADNTGSLQVLEKCGFRVTGKDRGFAHARGKEIDEYVLTLGG
ncbi:GNAT family N-acetyltransferase [Streptomyces sp. MUM 178J]|uniref:GNAT family N-acetyltransferase n=1 Tax=Streptomyces sp. MUM 178J TaxID=2791991 RepID=UPI001F0468EC|nr:GNAT family N-acetyltransferase [Streptomyces sp. MUM 178J]WRQ78816.1 GNAT family N-acetyltransferase [Streptomyces sp. MUM 178J]